MLIQNRLYLESKILKHIRQNNMVSFDGELAAKGMFMSELQKRMWYFIRKHGITDQDIYKIARRLEDQGFIELTCISGRVYLKPSTPKKLRTEEELENVNRDMRIPPKLTAQDIQLGKAVADRFMYERKRELEAEEKRAAIAPKEQEIIEEEDLNTLEDYLKDE